jgi:hypothetical protein
MRVLDVRIASRPPLKIPSVNLGNSKTMGPPLFLSATWTVRLDLNRTGSSEVWMYVVYSLTALLPLWCMMALLFRVFGLISYWTNQSIDRGDSQRRGILRVAYNYTLNRHCSCSLVDSVRTESSLFYIQQYLPPPRLSSTPIHPSHIYIQLL